MRLLECRFFWFVFVFFGSIDHRKVPCDALLVVVFRLLIRLKMNCDYNKRSNFNFVCFLPSLINGRFFYAVWWCCLRSGVRVCSLLKWHLTVTAEWILAAHCIPAKLSSWEIRCFRCLMQCTRHGHGAWEGFFYLGEVYVTPVGRQRRRQNWCRRRRLRLQQGLRHRRNRESRIAERAVRPASLHHRNNRLQEKGESPCWLTVDKATFRCLPWRYFYGQRMPASHV